MSRSLLNRSSNGATPTISPRGPVIDPADAADRLTAISIAGLAKSFNGVPVIRDIDLDIRAGELLGLLGPSGSGKTTLLRIIAGLERSDSGRIAFGGTDTTSIPVQKRAVGFVFQHYALFKHMTVADNVAYGLRARKRRDRPSRELIERRVGDLLELVKLSAFADRYPSQLSGGQRQRIALARALAVEPRVLLLDEPFGALDAQVRKDLRRWLREIHERTGQTTIFVTHDQDEALELSDRVAILTNGRLTQVGTPTEVQDHPASIDVLNFLGDAFEVPAAIADGQVIVGGRPVTLALDGRGTGPVRLFLRPWQIETTPLADAHLVGVVHSSFRAAGRTHASVAYAGKLVNVALAGAVENGREIGLRITGGHLFDAGPAKI